MKLFITSTNTDVGKTYVTQHLFHLLQNRGYKVGIFKPFQTERFNDHTYPDLETYKTQCGLSYEETSLYRFNDPISPHLAFKREPKQHFDRQSVIDRAQRFEASYDVVLIEGAGGIAVPIHEGKEGFYMTSDLIKDTADEMISVVPSRLGAISDILVHQHYVDSLHLPNNTLIMNRFTHSAVEQDNRDIVEKLTGKTVEIFPENGTEHDFSNSFLPQLKGVR